ncbi:hypothetical protein [Antricoccus suffuscus]|nr:hypothetical protein [Antricoccus suffuscus]
MNRAGISLSAVCVISGLLLVAGCSGGGDLSTRGTSNTGGGSGATRSGSTADNSTLHLALSRFDSSLAAKDLFASFGDTAALSVLAAKETETWKLLALSGSIDAFATGPKQAATIGADLSAAEYSISIGQPPGRLTLVAGGQDADTITSAAKKAGYEGAGVLSQKLDLENPLTVTVAQVEPKGDDLVVGGPGAKLESVDPDGESLTDLDEVAAVVECLGDVVAAQIAPNSENIDLLGVGVRSVDRGAQSVMCVKPKSPAEAKGIATDVADALKNGTMSNGQPYTKFFENVDVVAAGGVVKMTADNTANGQANTILQMVLSRDLPALPGY